MDENVSYMTQCNEGCSDLEPTSSNRLDPEYPRLIKVRAQTAEELNTCPFATVVVEENRLTGKVRARGVTCKRWRCEPCARQKIRQLAMWIKLACPNKLLTLTGDPALYKTPEEMWIHTAVRVPELIRDLRKRYGSIEYLRVVELHKSGWPHYHLMLRSDYLPQPVIKAAWQRLTGAEIVDIRQINNFFNSFIYLVKYLTKLRHVEWTDRHVTYSRGFFPVSVTPQNEPSEWRVLQQIAYEPWKWLEDQYPGQTVLQSAPLTFDLQTTPPPWIAPEEKPRPEKITQQDWGF